MYCKNCGKQVENEAIICRNCGQKVKSDFANWLKGKKWETGPFIGLIAATLFAPGIGFLLGIIFGILGLLNPNRKTQGLVLSILALLSYFITAMSNGIMMFSMFNEMGY